MNDTIDVMILFAEIAKLSLCEEPFFYLVSALNFVPDTQKGYRISFFIVTKVFKNIASTILMPQ